jgi:uncharacterized protein with PQ loop repeat
MEREILVTITIIASMTHQAVFIPQIQEIVRCRRIISIRCFSVAVATDA